jgi:peptide chain release factor 2
MKEILEKLEKLIEGISKTYEILDIEKKKDELKELGFVMSEPGFWANQKEAARVSKKAADLQGEIETWENMLQEAEENYKLAKELAEQDKEDDNEALKKELEQKCQELEELFKRKEFVALMDEQYDKENAIVAIHAGAGGTDAQDWAEMLLRMYLRYAEKNGWTVNIVDKSVGGEAGIKSVVLEIKGNYAYGYLKNEAGVHRLVRISPFDAEKMRHTSFALVEALPELEEVEEIKIKDEDLRIDVFRASGHGGQSVNTTDSAVRIKHLPTGITVNCQNERSQLQNKETALRILKSKLKKYFEAEQEEERQKIRGEFNEAAWGNQARSYVLHPYKMVKDHRSGYESQAVENVLNGDLDELIAAEMKNRKTAD